MGASFYPQSGVIRRARSIAPPPRVADPSLEFPYAVGLGDGANEASVPVDDSLAGTLPLYAHASRELSGRSRVLDVGSGDGRGTEWLTRHHTEVVAIDAEAPAVASTQRVAPRALVQKAELGQTPDLGVFDAVVCIDLLGYVAKPEDLLSALRSTVIPTSLAFIAEPRADGVQCLAPPLRRTFSPRSLTTLLTMTGFDIARWVDAPRAFVACVLSPSTDGSAHWLRQGYAHLASHRYDDALSCFERAEASPRPEVQLEAALGEAECFLSQRKRGTAVDAFLRARELCSEDARPLAGLSRIALARGEVDNAIELATVACRVDSTDVSAACAHAMVAQKTHHGETKERWVRASNLAPESFELALRVAQAAAAEQDYAAALWAVERVKSYGGHYGVPMHVALATSLLGTGRIADARDEARRAHRIAPNDPSVRALIEALR